MSDDLQADVQDDQPIEDIQNEEVQASETVNSGADLEPDSDDAHEQTQQDGAQAAINKQHKKYREEERRANELAEQNRQLQEQLLQHQPAEPSIPKAPDPFDDNYELLIHERDKAIEAKAAYDANQNLINQQRQYQAQQQQQQQQAEITTKLETYTSRAKAAGISEAKLQEAGNTVATFGISDNVVMAILDDQDGPLITQYLAGNPMEADSLRHMTDYQAAMFIHNKVRPQAAKFKPKTTNAPSPANRLQGNGVDPDNGKYKNLKGAKIY